MPSPKKGLTLVEIIAAVMIVTFGLVPVMRFAPNILKTKASVEGMTESIFLGTQKIEEVRGRVLDEFGGEGAYTEGETRFSDDSNSPYYKYKYTVDDTNLVVHPTYSDIQIKDIEVNVWHVDEPDNPVTLHTKIARREKGYTPTDRVANFTLHRSYNRISDAVNEAGDGHDIRARTGTYIENITVPVGVKLSGGWNADFTDRDPGGYSTVTGSARFISGQSEIKWFIIQ